MDAAVYNERVCVVISSPGIAEDDVRRRLGSALPLKFTVWEDLEYMAAIRRLKPRVIVVATADGRARDYAALLEVLLDSDSPTIATLALAQESLVVQQLGTGTLAYVHSLDDLLVE